MRKDTRPGTTSHSGLPDPNCRKLTICGKCFALRGRWSRPQGHGGIQKCGCTGPGKRGAPRRQQATWPGFDFNKIAELCYCCGAEVLRSGTRWAVWFCDDCMGRVDALNRRARRAVIPIGRHSLMAGVGLSGTAAKTVDPIEAFAEGLKSLREGINLLHTWATAIVAENLRACGFQKGKDVPVLEYMEAIAALPVDKARAFERVWAYLQSPRAVKT